MSNQPPLTQCPFCSAWPKMKIVSGLFVVVCTKCASMSGAYDNEASATKFWNKRINPDSNDKEVNKL